MILNLKIEENMKLTAKQDKINRKMWAVLQVWILLVRLLIKAVILQNKGQVSQPMGILLALEKKH